MLCVIKVFAKSLKVVQGQSRANYVCLPCTVSDIFGIEYCHDLEQWLRSLKVIDNGATGKLGYGFLFALHIATMIVPLAIWTQ